jgi:phage-related protein
VTRPVKLQVDIAANTRGVDDAGRAIGKLSRDVDHLGDEFAGATRKANEFARAARDAGRAAGGAGGGGAGGVSRGAGGLGRGAATSFQALPINPITAGLAVAGGAVASPFIGAAAGGAAIGAAGAGAVGLGVAGAARADPRIEEAFNAAVKGQAQRWEQASRDFVEPTLRGIAKINAAINDIGLEEMLSRAAAYADPLFTGIAGMVREVGSGLSALVEQAGPVIEVFRNELPQVGTALSTAFKDIAGGGRRAARRR